MILAISRSFLPNSNRPCMALTLRSKSSKSRGVRHRSKGALAWGISPTTLGQKAHAKRAWADSLFCARSAVLLNRLLFSQLHSCSAHNSSCSRFQCVDSRDAGNSIVIEVVVFLAVP